MKNKKIHLRGTDPPTFRLLDGRSTIELQVSSEYVV